MKIHADLLTGRYIYSLKVEYFNILVLKRSWHEKEKCWKLSGWANSIFPREMVVVFWLEPCFSIHFHKGEPLGVKSLRHRVEQAILKNFWLQNKKIFWGIFFFCLDFLSCAARHVEAVYLTPLYQFHPLHRFWAISWGITPKSCEGKSQNYH